MIDMHAHSNVSDGTFTPTEIIRLAKKLGLSAVALTDHNSIGGLLEAESESKRLGMTLVKGIEFSVRYGENRLIHILGLNIDPNNKGFMDIYTPFRRRCSELLDPTFDYLNNRGIEINAEMVKPLIEDGFMNRQTVAKFLVTKGYVNSMKEAWVNYLDHITYEPDELISPKEAFDAIHAAGGKTVIAHIHMPIGFKGYSDLEVRQHLADLKSLGLDGMEYYYPSYTKEDQMRAGQYIEDFALLKCGGSDFHGTNRAHIQLGIGEGDFHVPDSILETILDTSGDEDTATA